MTNVLELAMAEGPPRTPVFKTLAAAWEDDDEKPKADQPKLCKIADPDCEACQ